MTGAEALDVAREGIWVLIMISAPMMIAFSSGVYL